jgi:hypothetical protein
MVNASTQKRVDKLRPKTTPVASSIPTATTVVQPVKTPVTATQQTDPMKAKQSSI